MPGHSWPRAGSTRTLLRRRCKVAWPAPSSARGSRRWPRAVEPAAVRNVLFLCTGNSARSIMAEALLNFRGEGRFHAFSAGSHPKGEVHPLALETLRRHGIPVGKVRSKSWNEFEAPEAPALDFVFTVCDRAAAEVCPI